MEISVISYLGDLRTEATHLKSNKRVITDAPLDNNGKGEAFSPSDLLATSLGSCMITIMGIVAKRNNISIEGLTCKVSKIMTSNPRRVSEIHIEFTMPKIKILDKEKKLLKEAALHCPVAKSMHPEIIQKVSFNY